MIDEPLPPNIKIWLSLGGHGMWAGVTTKHPQKFRGAAGHPNLTFEQLRNGRWYVE